MHVVLQLLLAWAIDFTINVVPAFMPPSWTLLAFFYVHFHLPLLVLTVGGATTSTLGRLVLSWEARHWGRRIISDRQKREMAALGAWLAKRSVWQIPLAVLVFSLGPVPSNAIFIAAGLTSVRMLPVVIGFWIGRVISYTVNAYLTHKIVSTFQGIVQEYVSSLGGWIFQIAVILVLAGFTFIPWTKLLHIQVPGPRDSTNNS